LRINNLEAVPGKKGGRETRQDKGGESALAEKN